MAKILFKEFNNQWATGHAYAKKLKSLTEKMTNDVIDNIMNFYDDNQSKLTFDAKQMSIIDKLTNFINKQFEYWYKQYEKMAPIWATEFIDDVNDNVTTVLTQNVTKLIKLNEQEVKSINNATAKSNELKAISQAKKWVVKPDKLSQDVLNTKQAAIAENVALITKIPDDTKDKITDIVLNHLQYGGNRADLVSQLKEAGDFSQKRATLIARDQVMKANGILSAKRNAELGFNKLEWIKSKAGKTHRKSHIEANGKIFKADEGCYIDGEYIYPGQLINCKCTSRPIIEI